MEAPAPLSDTIVVLTGATSGIGLALTRALSKMGAQVVALGRSSSKLAKLQEALPSVQTVKVDLSDLESVLQAADQLIAALFLRESISFSTTQRCMMQRVLSRDRLRIRKAMILILLSIIVLIFN
jgi:NAD(P)-dependent dehydrogenase (short-subunit alcohol dehydrogenase family)